MRVILFTGKGGVGKTTTAAATALRLADRGVKTLLLSTDIAHSLSDALDVSLTDEPAEVAPGLWAVQVDTQGRFEAAWRDVQAFLIDMLARGGVDPITADELTVLPGVDEVLALLAVRELALTGNWDALVVDCAPTAETLRLLALPEALSWYLERVFPVHRRIAKGMRPFATMFGRGEVLPPDTLFEALLRLNDELASVRQLLGDPQVTSVRLVLTPESVVAAEARRTFTALALYGYSVDLVVANRVFPGGADEWRQGWAAAQRKQLIAIRESFAGLPVRELPYRAAEPIGAGALREVADELYGTLPGADPAPPSTVTELLRVEQAGDELVLHLALPLAERADVDAVRAGDDLVVSVGPNRRVLTLPSVLRRCSVAGGEFDGRELRVRFRPDEQLWPAATRRRPRPGPGTARRSRRAERGGGDG
jgi:arsenite/tail-anchored protein-transporting ATPase